jgi:hypothetical protein
MINKDTWNKKHIRLIYAFPPDGSGPLWYQIRYDGKIKEFSDEDFYDLPSELRFSYEAGAHRSMLKRKENGSKE